MTTTAPKIVFGAGSITSAYGYGSPSAVTSLLNSLKSENIHEIDTAASYGESEALLGQANESAQFEVSTKLPGGLGQSPSTLSVVIEEGRESLRRLNTKQVDIYYIHAPDKRVSLQDTLAGINQLYREGAFRRFGLSNFSATGVDDVVSIAKEHGYVLPTVYQGNYSAVARRTETELLPTLRKHSTSFYAYSPIAGGFLAKMPEQVINGTGRWDPSNLLGKMYHGLYSKPSLLEGLALWNTIAQDSGISNVELAYRWVTHNSKLNGELGDGVVIGAKTTQSVKEVAAFIRNGPVNDETAARIDAIWDIVKDEAPLDNWHDYLGKTKQSI